MRESLRTEFAERERLGKIAETTTFIRDTLREAAPRGARNYVHHVSVEACQMFREICGQAEQTLSWADDYGIMLEEDGYERPFGNLSGGEQTAAALSVRLSILKQLSDIRIAFFDEPTTNMDVERRENLAQQIAQIKNFDQLFVISHDDTFEGYVDNTLRNVIETINGNFRKKTNLEWWNKLDKAAAKHQIIWEWTRGHAGHEIQEIADKTARKIATLGRVDKSLLEDAVLDIGIKEI